MSTSPTAEAAPFARRLGLFDATMLVAGSMIGSGIFIVSADIARDVGSSGWLLVVWLITGILTVLGALSYGELAALMPHAGGQYVFLREAYGPLWGFLYGWTGFLVIQTGTIAAVGVAFGKFLGVVIPSLGTDAILYRVDDLNWTLSVPVPWLDDPVVFFRRDRFTINAGQLVGVAVVVFLSLLNCFGVRLGTWVQNLFTVVKTGTLILLILIGVTVAADPRSIAFNLNHAWDGLASASRFTEVTRIVPVAWLAGAMVLSGAMVGSLFSSDAWNNVTFIAGEVRDPHHNLPRALALGTGGVIVLYLLANVAYLAALPVQGTSEPHAMDSTQEIVFRRGIAHARDDRVGTAVVEMVAPAWGASLMAVAIMISTFGCANGLILSGARLYFAMARDGLFFRAAGTLNRREVPAIGLIVQMIWTSVLVFSGSYSELLDYVIFAALLFYVLTVTSLFVFRVRHPDWPRPYRAFGYPLLPLVYVLTAAFVMLSLLVVRPVYSWPSFLIILSGIPVYFLWRRRPNSSP